MKDFYISSFMFLGKDYSTIPLLGIYFNISEIQMNLISISSQNLNKTKKNYSI